MDNKLQAEGEAEGSYPGYMQEPPSYYDAVHNAPPLPSCPPIAPKITYVDFLPDGMFSKYPDLIEKANFWLAQNRLFRLQSCETVTVLAKNGVITEDRGLCHVPIKSGREYAQILRCWLITLETPLEIAQVIGTIARIPNRDRNTLTITFGNGRAMMPYSPSFKPMGDCLKSLNEELQENPIPGKIMRIETVKMKVTQSMSAQVNLDPNVLFWSESGYYTIYANYVRLFYIEGEPANEEIGWRDVVSSYQINPSNFDRPNFEPFTGMLYKAGHWAHMQKDKRITNIQTVDTPVIMDPVFPRQQSRPVIDTNRADWTSGDRMFGCRGLMVKFLRVYYVKSPQTEIDKPYCLTQREFIPYRLTQRTYEMPADNIQRLGVWLGYNSYNSVISENDVLCVETVGIQTNLASERPVDSEKVTYLDRGNSGYDLVSGIRLYLNGMYQEPPVEILRIPHVIFAETSSCCTII